MGGCGSSGPHTQEPYAELTTYNDAQGSLRRGPAAAPQLPPGPVLLGKNAHKTPPPVPELKFLKQPAPVAEPETLYADRPPRTSAVEVECEQDRGEVEEDEEDEVWSPLPGAEHIGWVAKCRGDDPRAQDRSEDFFQVLLDIRAGMHTLSRRWDLAYLIVPGLFCSKYPTTYMRGTQSHLRSLGLDCRVADVDVRRSVKDNAATIADLVEEISTLTGKRVVLVGHSKGGCDVIAALARHGSRMKSRTAGILCLQSPLGGSPLAGDFVERRLTGNVLRTLRYILGNEVDALGELTYERRREELDAFPFPYGAAPLLTFSSETNRRGSLLGPLAAHTRRRYQGLANDGLTACPDAHLPCSMTVAFEADWDHGACAFPEPLPVEREELVNEALLTLLVQQVPPMGPCADTSLTPIFDFWHHVRREHTFHHGDPWSGERKCRVAFYAFHSQVRGAEPVHSFWNTELSVHTFHLGEPAEGETRQGIQFYAFRNAADGTEPVFSFWHEENADYTIHMGEPARGETRKDALFHAYRHPRPVQMTVPSVCRLDRI